MSTIAAIPPALEVCDKYPQFNDEQIKGTLPLILVMLVPSIASTFTVTTVFLIQLTGIEIGLMQYVFILFGSVGAALATIGVPAPVDLFGIPVSQAVFFLLPWTLTAARFELIYFVMLDFGVVQYFKPKEKGEAKKTRKRFLWIAISNNLSYSNSKPQKPLKESLNRVSHRY
jgi:hypothetical protein